jgi:hypothetical protein
MASGLTVIRSGGTPLANSAAGLQRRLAAFPSGSDVHRVANFGECDCLFERRAPPIDGRCP